MSCRGLTRHLAHPPSVGRTSRPRGDMTSYAFWNNKGGVGKSFLCFVAAAEYAHRHPNADVYVLDLCPQANVSETLLGGYESSPAALRELGEMQPRSTVAGYLEARLSSPFVPLDDVSPYVSKPHDFNRDIPENLSLVCGDNLLEVLSEAIRQTSQLALPGDAWRRVETWLKDLVAALRACSGQREQLVHHRLQPELRDLHAARSRCGGLLGGALHLGRQLAPRDRERRRSPLRLRRRGDGSLRTDQLRHESAATRASTFRSFTPSLAIA